MDFGNGLEVTEFYNAAWRILNSTDGPTKCVHTTKHTMTIMKNPENADIVLPIRGTQELYNLLSFLSMQKFRQSHFQVLVHHFYH